MNTNTIQTSSPQISTQKVTGWEKEGAVESRHSQKQDTHTAAQTTAKATVRETQVNLFCKALLLLSERKVWTITEEHAFSRAWKADELQTQKNAGQTEPSQ